VQLTTFIVDDVVSYVDTHYRSVAQASARAISGHSMGGFGALNMGMRHPDIFSVVYSLSPGLFYPNGLAESQMFYSEGFINANMLQLKGLVVDYGRQDEYAWIPKGCEYFGAQLTTLGSSRTP